MRYSLLAGQRALAAYAYEEALAHFERGLVSRDIALSGSQPAPDEEAAALLFGLGSAQFARVERHRFPEAITCLRRAFDYYTEAGEVERAVAVAQHPLPAGNFQLVGAAQIIQQALALVQRDSQDEGRLLSQNSKAVYFEETDIEAARDAYTRALAIAQRENETELELRTLGNAASVEMFHGNFQELSEMCLRGLELTRRVDNLKVEADLQTYAAGGLLMTGDLQGAKPHLESLRDLVERLGQHFYLATAFFASVWASILEGDWAAARNYSDQGLAGSPMDTRCLAVRLQLEFELGQFDQREAYLERILDAMHFEDALAFCRKGGYRPGVGLDLLRLRRHPVTARQRRRPGQGRVPAGRVPGHLQRAGYAALD